MTTPPTLPEAVRQGHKGSLAPTGRTGQPQRRCQCCTAPSITSATPITAPPGFHQPRKHIFEATVGLRSLRLLKLGLSRVLFLKVETMDKENENAALEETVGMIVANVIRGATEQFLDLQKKGKEAEYVAKNIQWTTCKDFTVERGRQQIEEYISQTWEVHESWLYWSEFLREEELMYSKRYHYRVLWSIPTRRKPIPQATASVYFVIEISKIKPATLPVEVFFFLESSRLILRPEQCRFREKWLKDIIENKLILKRSLTF
ncbi:A-kinase anchor protein 14 isoform X1 [Cygnus olor]|uniref:A-kinase anchor protein 14 isoform X1 n=2 Tax=Cygnus olor TaxID=8869 RepID=UPI001ADEA5B0|nr:A-kinase anchor protein 14 isoform X1 [Cygnus olor]